jgi:hypothetical protein
VTGLIWAVALVVATTAAIRGVWSPCGLSMLSSITPMTEAGRGNRFNLTAAWFVVGATVGGLTLGVVGAAGAAGLGAAGVDGRTLAAVGALVLAVTAAIDLGLAGVDLPIFKRQVTDAWLRRYRSWVYGAGFGWQIGFGLATYIMTAGVFATLALAVLTASPVAAVAVGAVFGLVRGAAVFAGRSATTPAALARIHARLDELAPWSRGAAALAQLAGLALLGAVAVHPLVALVAPALVLSAWARGRRPARPAAAPS